MLCTQCGGLNGRLDSKSVLVRARVLDLLGAGESFGISNQILQREAEHERQT